MPTDTEPTFRPSDVARELNVTTNTVRNWSKRYSDHLSDGAKPEGKTERAFNLRDVETLHYIKAHIDDGYSHGWIEQRLPETTFTGDIDLVEDNEPDDSTDSTVEPQEAPQTAIAPTVGLDALGPLLSAMQENAITAERTQQQDSRIERIDKRQDRLTILVYVLIAVVVVLCVLLVLVMVLR